MKRLLKFIFLLFPFALLLLSCVTTGKNWGSSVQDDDVKAMFENYEYVSDYSYFYTSHGNGIEAIVGLKKDYELVKVSGWLYVTNWQQFEPGVEKLKELVEVIKADRYPDPNYPIYGYIISASGEDQVGVLYRIGFPGSATQILLRDGNQIEVIPHKYTSTTFGPP